MEWRSIAKGAYEVSQAGDIRRVRGGRGSRPGELLKQQYKEGYKCVSLSVDGWARRFYVHRLVAEAFIGLCPPENVVNHKDGDRAHNHISNLEYVTTLGNALHASETGLLVQGERHRFSKLTVEQVQEIRRLAAKGARNGELAFQFGLSPSTVNSIVYRRTWKHVAKGGDVVVPRKIIAPRAKINEDQVREIRKLAASGTSQVALCRMFGLTGGTMHHIVHGITWKSVE